MTPGYQRSNAPVSFNLPCPWCEFYIWVNPRGQRGNDPGSGVEAAQSMQRHVERIHDRSWREYLETKSGV